MKSFFEDTAAVFLSLLILLGIMFVPNYVFTPIKNFLDYLARGSSEARAFGNYLIQKEVVGVITIGLIIFLSVTSKRKF